MKPKQRSVGTEEPKVSRENIPMSGVLQEYTRKKDFIVHNCVNLAPGLSLHLKATISLDIFWRG